MTRINTRTQLAAVWPPTAAVSREPGHKPQTPLQAAQRRLMQKLADLVDLFFERRPGGRRFTVIRSVFSNARMCLYVPNLEDAVADLSAAVARRIFKWVLSYTPEIEARLRGAAGARP